MYTGIPSGSFDVHVLLVSACTLSVAESKR